MDDKKSKSSSSLESRDSRSSRHHRPSRSRSRSRSHGRNSERRRRSRSPYRRQRSRSRSKNRDHRRYRGNNHPRQRDKPPKKSAPEEDIDGVPLDRLPLNNPNKNDSSIPKYYKRSNVNSQAIMEQTQKRKLLWQNQKNPKKESVWDTASFSDGDSRNKFRKLMGIKTEDTEAASTSGNSQKKNNNRLFQDLDKQYEIARISTHTQRGVGLGYSSHGPGLVYPKQ